jgi:hypothetical protein
MEAKIFENLRNKGITDSSLKLYYSNLKRLNNGEEIKSLTFLKDVEKIMQKLEKYKSNTQRSYVISIVSLLKEEPKLKKLYDSYYQILMKYNKEKEVNNDKSETQKENWMTQEDVLKVFETLKEGVKDLDKKKKWNEDDFTKYLHFLVLSLYTLQAPRRNLDYQFAIMTKKYDPEKMDKKFNYLDLTNWNWIFNNYKTKGTYHTQVVPVAEEMKPILEVWLTHHPHKAEFKKKTGVGALLVDFHGMPFENNNAITRILNKIFGKRIGCSLLRSIYLTDKYADNLNDLKEDASAMGTSSNTIQNQYIKLEGKGGEMEAIILP